MRRPLQRRQHHLRLHNRRLVITLADQAGRITAIDPMVSTVSPASLMR